MPKYDISLSDGRTVTLEADQEPTEEEVFSALGENFGAASSPNGFRTSIAETPETSVEPPNAKVLGLPALFAKGMKFMGTAGKAALYDFLQSQRDLQDPQRFVSGEGPRVDENLQAMANGEAMPTETAIKRLPTALRIPASVPGALVETIPQIAAVAGGQALGIPAPIGAAAVFGSTEEGFSPKAAAIAAVLPIVGKYTGALSEAVAAKLGVSNDAALNIINKLGGATGAAGVLTADQLYEISQLPEDQQKEAYIEMASGVASQMALGAMGERYQFKKGEPNAKTIRSDTRQPVEEGQIAQSGENVRRENLQQPPPGKPEPVVEGELARPAAETLAVGDEGKVAEAPPAEEPQVEEIKPLDVASGSPITTQPKPPQPKPVGAATPEDISIGTRMARATQDIERAMDGQAPREPTEVQAMIPAWERAGETLSKNPKAGIQLMERQADDPTHVFTGDEAALALRHKIDLQNEINDLAESTLNPEASPEEKSVAHAKIDRLSDELSQTRNAIDSQATVAGRALRWQQAHAKNDYSFASRLERIEDAGQRKLSPEERESLLKQLHDEQDYTRRLEEHALKLKDEVAAKNAEQVILTLERDAAKERATQLPYSEKILAKADEIVRGWEGQVGQAHKNLSELFARVGSGPDPTAVAAIIKELAIIGRAKIGRGIVESGRWLAAMRHDLGGNAAKAEPFLQDAYAAAMKLHDDSLAVLEKSQPKAVKAVREKSVKEMDVNERRADLLDKIKSRVEVGKLDEITLYARKLVNVATEQGARGWRQIADVVHGHLKEIIPDLDYRKTMRIIAGEDEFKPLSTKESEVAARQGKQEIAQVVNIQDQMNKVAPKKRGHPYQEHSQAMRTLVKIFKRAQKLFPVKIVDPERQLKSALDTRKRYYDNAIADLEQEIRDKKKIVRDRPLPPTDSELEGKITRRNQLKAERDEIFKDDDQAAQLKRAIAVLDRSTEEYQRKAAAGEFSTEKKSSPFAKNPEYEAAKARRDAEKSTYEELRELDDHFQEEKRNRQQTDELGKIDARIEEVTRQINEGDITAKKKPAGPVLPELASKRAELAELNKIKLKLQAAERAKTPAEREARRVADVQKRIEEVTRQINEGDIAAKAKGSSTVSPKRAALQEELAELNKIKAKLRAAEKSPTAAEREAKSLVAIQARIETVVKQINEGDLATKPKPPVSADKASLRAELADLNRVKQQLRNAAKPKSTPEERAISAYKTRVTNENALKLERAANLESKVASGTLTRADITPRRFPKTDVLRDPESAKLWMERQKIREAVEQAEWKAKRSLRSPIRKVLDRILDVPRAAVGAVVFGHGTALMSTHAGGFVPRVSMWKIYWPHFFSQWKMWASKTAHGEAIYRHVNDPMYAFKVRAKLAIEPHKVYTDADMFAQWAAKFGKVGARGMDAIKFFRSELFDKEWAAVSDVIKNDPELSRDYAEHLAKLINHSTGAYDLGTGALATGARVALFAPSLYLSRWSRILSDPVKTAVTILDWKNASMAEQGLAKTRIKNAVEFAAVYAGMMALNQGLLSSVGSNQKVNFNDPSKSDWLKFKAFGHTVALDGGLLEPVRWLGKVIAKDLMARRSKWEQAKGSRVDQAYVHTGEYVRGKLLPPWGIGIDLATGQNYEGRAMPNSTEKSRYPGQKQLTWSEWTASHGPIFASGASKLIYEELRKKGFSDIEAQTWMKAAAEMAFSTTGVHAAEDYSLKKP